MFGCSQQRKGSQITYSRFRTSSDKVVVSGTSRRRHQASFVSTRLPPLMTASYTLSPPPLLNGSNCTKRGYTLPSLLRRDDRTTLPYLYRPSGRNLPND